MSSPRTVLFDNEAIQALASHTHRKHRRVLAVVHESAARRLRRGTSARLIVPTAVRVEAGYDRRSPTSTAVNRLRIDDASLDRDSADAAARVRVALNVSVADAHLAACLASTPGPHAVVTSDVDDLHRIAEHLGTPVNIIRT